MGLGKVIANLQSDRPALSDWAMREIAPPPVDYLLESKFYAACSPYYSKGFQVLYADGRIRLGHGGMTNHCGGIIGHQSGIQFVAVSNWNASQDHVVDTLLGTALKAVL